MVKRWEVFHNIGAQHITITAGAGLQAVKRPVRAFAHPVGVTVADEAAIKHRFNQITQRVMNHPITKRCGANLAPLRFVDEEVDVGTWTINAFAQFALKRHQFVGHIKLKSGSRPLPAFAFGRFAIS